MPKGFTLLEIMIAIAIMEVGVVGAYVAVLRTSSSLYSVSSRYIASQLAQEGIELVRNIRDKNWLKGFNWNRGLEGCQTGCEIDYNDSALSSSYEGRNLYINGSNGFYEYIDSPSPNDKKTPFKRKITIKPETGAPALKVTVNVSWQEREKNSHFVVEGKLYDWKP